MLSKKMLEDNHFFDGTFQSVVSSFDPKKSYRITKSTFGSPPSLNSSGKKFNPKLIMLGDQPAVSLSAKKPKRVGSQENGLTFNSILTKNGFLKSSQSLVNL
jgi:hypothetical protein